MEFRPTNSRDQMAVLTTMSTMSVVSMGVIVVGSIIALAGLACLIAYVGYKKTGGLKTYFFYIILPQLFFY